MPFSITTQITGVSELVAELHTLNLSRLADRLETLMRQIGADAGDYSKAPELPNQHYIRTGDLGAGWTGSQPLIQTSGDSLLGTLTNDVSYAADVMGSDGDQKDIFAGRWRTTDAITDEWEERVSNQIESALDELIQL